MPENVLSSVIDVHHHFERSGLNVDGTPWRIEHALHEMDRNGVTTAIGYAGPLYGTGAAAGKQARETNEWTARICADHPGRFGMFASVPMNDVALALNEIAYVFDVLHADGIGLTTHYDGSALGDAKFRPVFEELDRRGAVVYVHPNKAPCTDPLLHATLNGTISEPWLEFPANTARTILSLWEAGLTRQLPNVRFIFCHGGGIMPILLGRIDGFSGWKTVGPEGLAALFPDGIYAEFAKFHFDLAQAYAPETMQMLRRLVPASHLLYGSDYSYFPIAHSLERLRALELPPAELRMIEGANAAGLLPRLRTPAR